ncbi:hypothetical protein SAMN04488116_2370 [Flagellimonas flava]|uniref:Uncharacterized protein n=2 Tax=Flagellimonas flava TaxID=570519 RepID=A0A1M5MC15_9FLAO|nr:hypothetical protein SAMN04488116_2370 [Allomuricauda flava]
MVLVCTLVFGCGNEHKSVQQPENYMVSKELDKAIIGQSWELLEKAQQLADTGSTINDVLALLPEDAQIMVNNNSLVYFLEGGVPMLVSFDKTKKRIKGNGAIFGNASLPPSISTNNALFAKPYIQAASQEVNVVGYERGEYKRQKKEALLVSAYPRDFGGYDDVISAAEYLSDQNNYTGSIVLRSQNLSLADYTDWQKYDLVHVSSHGERLCGYPFEVGDKIEITTAGESNFCGTVLKSGVKHGYTTIQEMQDFFFKPENYNYIDHIVIGWEDFYLKPSFFTQFYLAANLNNKIWVFSACEMGQRSDMQTTIQSVLKDSHFFYWQNTVNAEDAFPAFQEFYKNLAFEGLDAKKAYEKIPPNLKRNLPSEFVDPKGENKDTIETTTQLLHLQTGKPRHGIEVIELLHPIHETILQEGDLYPLNGDFGDGQTELMEVKLDLLGYTKEEFIQKGMTLSLFVRGQAILDHFVFLPDMPNDGIMVKKIPNKEYGVRLIFDGMEIGDIPKDLEKMEVKGYLHLDDERFSIHSEMVNINPKDVRVTARGTNTVTITYDNDTGASKFQSASAPSDVYMDTKGLVYVYVDRPQDRGWKKINMSGYMGQQMASKMMKILDLPMDVDILLGKEGLSSEVPFPTTPKPGKNLFKPLVNWPNQITQAKLSRSPNFERRETTCPSGKGDCLVFYGIQGRSKGVVIHFNELGKLERMKYKGQTLTYNYGDYTVNVPLAKELKLPSF